MKAKYCVGFLRTYIHTSIMYYASWRRTTKLYEWIPTWIDQKISMLSLNESDQISYCLFQKQFFQVLDCTYLFYIIEEKKQMKLNNYCWNGLLHMMRMFQTCFKNLANRSNNSTATTCTTENEKKAKYRDRNSKVSSNSYCHWYGV